MLLDLKGEDSFNKEEMIGIIMDLVVAGVDTSALTVEWILFEIVRNSRSQDKFRDEILKSPTKELHELKYLQVRLI